jgi:hypothetical protein
MHPIQGKLLELSKRENLAKLSLRDMARLLGMPKEVATKDQTPPSAAPKERVLSNRQNQGCYGTIGQLSRMGYGAA